MLSRTKAVLEGYPTAVSAKHQLGARALCESALSAVTRALKQRPAAPPEPVDSRVDMLFIALTSHEAQFVASLFRSAEAVPFGIALDAIQQKRNNPWGGFREAWLEHYNHCKNKAQGSVGMAQTEVLSEVAGTVWKVHVKPGETVRRDQELMILESMKMEIPVDAPSDGTVVQVLVDPEEGVEEDQVLLIIES